MGPVSDRRASNGDLLATDQSNESSDTARVPRLAAVDPFCELLFFDAPGSQRALHFDGSPTALLEPTLHAELGMDAVYAARGNL